MWVTSYVATAAIICICIVTADAARFYKINRLAEQVRKERTAAILDMGSRFTAHAMSEAEWTRSPTFSAEALELHEASRALKKRARHRKAMAAYKAERAREEQAKEDRALAKEDDEDTEYQRIQDKRRANRKQPLLSKHLCCGAQK